MDEQIQHEPPQGGFLLGGGLHVVDWRAYWDHVLPGLEQALAHSHEGLRTEDVYCELKSGRAALLVCTDGFVIVKETTNEAGQRDLLVWFAHGHGDVPLVPKHQGDMVEIAAQMKCAGLRFATTRRGFERALPAGWQQLYTVWRLPLEK